MHWSILTSTMSGRAVPKYVRYRNDQTAENVAAYDCVQTELVMAQYGEVFKNMKIFKATGGFSRLRPGKHMMAALMPLSLLFAAWPQNLLADQDAPAPAPAATSQPPYTQQTPEELQRLVAPIALYPDSLVAQVLAASTFPEQVVEADRWVQAN